MVISGSRVEAAELLELADPVGGRSGLTPRVNRYERKAARRRPLRFAISRRQAKRTRIPAVPQRQFHRRGILRLGKPTPRKRSLFRLAGVAVLGSFPPH